MCDLLFQPKTDPVISGSESQNFMHQRTMPGTSSGTSLLQLMSEHDQRGQGGGVSDTGRATGNASLNAFAIGPNTPASLTSTQNSLSLGTLASLNMSSASHSSALCVTPPSLLAVSLSSLSLSNPKVATTSSSVAPPPGFTSLSSVLQSNHPSLGTGTGGKTTVADPKGSPSLADLIQEHSNCSPTFNNSFPSHHSSISSVKHQGVTAPAQMLSLSQLASQHQNKEAHILSQSQNAETHTLSTPKSTSITPSCPGGLPSLSKIVLQHQTHDSFAFPQTLSTESSANAQKQPPGLSEVPSLSHLASQHQRETTNTSNGSEYSLALLLSPEKPERAGVFVEGGAKSKLHPKPYHKNSRGSRLAQNIDLSAHMAKSLVVGPHHYNYNLSSTCKASPFALGLDSSVFARPSVFAITLSIQSPSRQKRRRNIIKGKIKGQRTQSGHQALLYKSQVKSKEPHTPFLPITPFRFDTPSPDDIVRAKQKKAFTR